MITSMVLQKREIKVADRVSLLIEKVEKVTLQ